MVRLRVGDTVRLIDKYKSMKQATVRHIGIGDIPDAIVLDRALCGFSSWNRKDLRRTAKRKGGAEDALVF